MHLLLMAQHFAPEEVSGAVLATELATDLAAHGQSVTFVTCAPNYPGGKVFSGYRNRVYHTEQQNGIRIVRTWSYISPQHSFWRRILNYGTFSASAFYGGLFSGKPDVIFSYSPPLPLGVAAWLLSRWWRVPWIMRLEDLYPDTAIAAGVLRNRFAIRFFSALEKFLYRRATHLSLISEDFRRNLLQKGVPADKLSVTPVWADPGEVRPLPRENQFRQQHDLNDSFVVLYAGNLGHTSAVEDLLDAADLLRTQPTIRFVLVGEGVKKAELLDIAQRQQLTNVLFLPFQPRERFAEMMAAADVSVVTLNPSLARTSLPSKLFNIMASGRPVLAIAPHDSEVAQVVERAHCGIVVQPGDPQEVANQVRFLRDNAAHGIEMGQRGRAELETRYSRERCVREFTDLLKQAAG